MHARKSNRYFLTYIDINGEAKKRILPVDDSVTLMNRSSVEVSRSEVVSTRSPHRSSPAEIG